MPSRLGRPAEKGVAADTTTGRPKLYYPRSGVPYDYDLVVMTEKSMTLGYVDSQKPKAVGTQAAPQAEAAKGKAKN